MWRLCRRAQLVDGQFQGHRRIGHNIRRHRIWNALAAICWLWPQKGRALFDWLWRRRSRSGCFIQSHQFHSLNIWLNWVWQFRCQHQCRQQDVREHGTAQRPHTGRIVPCLKRVPRGYNRPCQIASSPVRDCQSAPQSIGTGGSVRASFHSVKATPLPTTFDTLSLTVKSGRFRANRHTPAQWRCRLPH